MPINKHNIGTTSSTIGTAPNGRQINPVLGTIPVCSKAACPAFKPCKYIKGGICNSRRQYLERMVNFYLDNIKDPTEADLFILGTILMPLFNQLSRLNLEQVGITEVVVEDVKIDGRRHHVINPIISETRHFIALVWQILKETGIVDDILPFNTISVKPRKKGPKPKNAGTSGKPAKKRRSPDPAGGAINPNL